eukprot:s15_g43.t1
MDTTCPAGPAKLLDDLRPAKGSADFFLCQLKYRMQRASKKLMPLWELGKQEVRKHYFGDIYRAGRYKPLHPELFENQRENLKRWLSPTFLTAATAEHPDFKDVLREEAPGVYSFEMFNLEFCNLLLEEIDHAQQTAREARTIVVRVVWSCEPLKALDRPNGMNRYGVVLNQLGLEPLITILQQESYAFVTEYLMPLMTSLFPTESKGCEDHHCFIVRYRADEDVGLDMHEDFCMLHPLLSCVHSMPATGNVSSAVNSSWQDDSDITLNACLGKEFTGATLSFCGLVTDEKHRKLQHTYTHAKGRAVIHLGRHRHGRQLSADNIESGERVNFILWSVSETYRNSKAYQLHRLRSSNAETPDPICLSYTHDRDYTKYLPKPTKSEALSRGVIMEVVERRLDMYQRPVLDMARPIEEINSVPSVCLFLEGLPPYRQHQLFQNLLEVANEVHESLGRVDGQVPAIIFFVALQPSGAVPQVREMSAVTASPSLVILDVDGEKRYRLESDKDLDAAEIRGFVAAFREGKLQAEPLGSSPEAEDNADVKRKQSAEEAPASTEAEASPAKARRSGCTLL